MASTPTNTITNEITIEVTGLLINTSEIIFLYKSLLGIYTELLFAASLWLTLLRSAYLYFCSLAQALNSFHYNLLVLF